MLHRLAAISGAALLLLLTPSTARSATPPTAGPIVLHDLTSSDHFSVQINGVPIGGVIGVTGLSRLSKGSGRNQFDAITLERGLTSDAAFSQWANQVFGTPAPGQTPGQPQEVIISIGSAAVRLDFQKCVPVKWSPPKLTIRCESLVWK
jgi:hypothetical protein